MWSGVWPHRGSGSLPPASMSACPKLFWPPSPGLTFGVRCSVRVSLHPGPPCPGLGVRRAVGWSLQPRSTQTRSIRQTRNMHCCGSCRRWAGTQDLANNGCEVCLAPSGHCPANRPLGGRGQEWRSSAVNPWWLPCAVFLATGLTPSGLPLGPQASIP